jgi:hypothetical protein
MLQKLTKKLNLLVRVIVPLLAVASFFGCSSALESDISGGAGTGGLAASVQKLSVAQPASLAGTDWGGDTSAFGKPPYYVVANFSNAVDGNFLETNTTAPTPFEYTYNPSNGTGTIDDGTNTGKFTINSAGTSMVIDMPGRYPAAFTVTLISPKQADMTGTVWNTITPRDIYSSIDFETKTVQTTFGDGTFPLYDLLYYDGVSAGLIQTLGLFYLRYNEKHVLTVVFPAFYNFHMGVDVVYTPSEEVRASIENTVWYSSDIDETVTFSGGRAFFDGNADEFDAPYVYNGYQAGGAGGPSGSTDYAGSFIVEDHGLGNAQSITFYNYMNRNNAVTFYKQIQPLEDEASAKE